MTSGFLENADFRNPRSMMIMIRDLFTIIVASSWFILPAVQGHGRLIEPPSRSSMWRYGFKTPPNYNDNELFCGGFTVQWSRHGGKCGICGDPWHAPQPRPNEAGGKYGQGIIVRSYVPGQVIEAVVQLTANHRGFFEFKLCPNNNPKRIADQECLDEYPLVVDDTGETTYPVTNPNSGNFPVRLRLPPGLKCSQCVFQWSYTSGNNWGSCPDGTGAVGCGPQETFRGCADVSIGSEASVNVNQAEPETNNIQTSRPYKPRPTKITSHFHKPTKTSYAVPKRKYQTTTRPSTKPTHYQSSYQTYNKRPRPSASTVFIHYVKPTRPSASKPVTVYHRYSKPIKPSSSRYHYTKPTKSSLQPERQDIGDDKRCHAADGPWKRAPGMDSWCDQNCGRGYCPPSHCQCD